MSAQTFARWDGQATPVLDPGEALEIPIRLGPLADLVEVHHRRGGVPAAMDLARQRSRTQLDPQAVGIFTLVSGVALILLVFRVRAVAKSAADPAFRVTQVG
jgi:hypothetical protein